MTKQTEPRRTRRGGARLAKEDTRAARAAGRPRARAKRKLTKREKRRLILLIVGIVLVALLCLFLWYRSWAKAPELPTGQTDTETDLSDPEQLNGTQPYVTGDRKDKFYTFLIVGRDTGGGGNTDTLMLAAYDVANQQAALMSIPRDTMVNVNWDVKKINSVYNMNLHNGEDAAIDALEDAVAGLVGFRPDFTITMEWEAVGAIVDAIGGVWFDVPWNMYYRDAYQDLFINQPKGYRLLDGEDAMEVIRWRKNNSGVSTGSSETDGSDLARTKVQQDFIAAVIKQCLQLKNVTKINQIAAVFTEYVDTELTVGNLVYFAEQALLGGFSTDNLYSCTMPNTATTAYSRSYKAYLSYVVPNADELSEIVNQYFNPYQQDVTLANLDIMSVNSDGSVSSSTGVVKDSQAAQSVASQHPADTPVSTEPVDENEMEPVAPEETGTPEESGDPAGTENPEATETPAETPTPTPEPVPTPTPDGGETSSSSPTESPAQPSDQPADQNTQTPAETSPPAESAPAESTPADQAPEASSGDDLFTLPEGVT